MRGRRGAAPASSDEASIPRAKAVSFAQKAAIKAPNASLRAPNDSMNPASELRLRDIATSAVLTVVPDLPLRNAIQLFVDAQVSCLVVTEGGDRPVGIITERDQIGRAHV